jgi:hypothetical protein
MDDFDIESFDESCADIHIFSVECHNIVLLLQLYWLLC